MRTTSLASAFADSDLAAALHALPVNERAALLLVGVEGLAVADAASVLGVTPERVVDLANAAAQTLRQNVPEVASADDGALVAAVRALPITPAAPPFWDAIEREALAAAAAAGPKRLSPWVWVGVAAVAVVAIAGLAFALSGGDDDETVTIATSTTTEPAPTSTTVPLTTMTTAPVETTTTAPTTTAPTTTAATTTTEPPETGPVDRGEVAFDGGAATLAGTLDGRPERWQLSVGDGETLVLPSRVNGVEVLVLDGDGNQVAPDGTAGTLQVFESTGDRSVQLRAAQDGPLDYVVDVGLSSAGTGWLSVAQEEGSTTAAGELTALTTVACTATPDALDAELEYADDSEQRLLVALTGGTDADTVTWTGPVEATGSVSSTSSTANGELVDGAFDSGPNELLGRPFGVAVLGCEEG